MWLRSDLCCDGNPFLLWLESSFLSLVSPQICSPVHRPKAVACAKIGYQILSSRLLIHVPWIKANYWDKPYVRGAIPSKSVQQFSQSQIITPLSVKKSSDMLKLSYPITMLHTSPPASSEKNLQDEWQEMLGMSNPRAATSVATNTASAFEALPLPSTWARKWRRAWRNQGKSRKNVDLSCSFYGNIIGICLCKWILMEYNGNYYIKRV